MGTKKHTAKLPEALKLKEKAKNLQCLASQILNYGEAYFSQEPCVSCDDRGFCFGVWEVMCGKIPK